MTINVHDVGDLVRVTGTFTDSADLPADPTALSFAFKDPSGSVTTYVFPTDAQLVKDSVGIYHVDVDVVEPGDWHYRWISTGAGQGAQIGQFMAKPNQVAA